jgi:glucose-6-phosphate 1-epimerase
LHSLLVWFGSSVEGIEKNGEGLEFVKLTHPSGSSAEVYLFGGVPTAYTDKEGTAWLAVRKDAKMDGSKPISGGMCHCFPQFGSGPIQQHGFARNVAWEVAASSASAVTLKLKPSPYSAAMWDKAFECTFTVGLSDNSLDTTLVVANQDVSPFNFQAALHR